MQFIPPEIFAKFCTFLSPNDLFNLSQVCRKFRGYLYAPNSFSTQQIWKISRLQFMPKEDMPPPEGMSEEKYVRLLITERGCQICKKTKECKIYWEFEVRCCEKCFLKKTSSIMPCVRVHKLHYWKEQIDFVYSQYCGLSRENLQTWLEYRKHMLDSLMKYVEQRESKEANFRHEFEVDHSNILNFFSSLSQPLPSDPPSQPLPSDPPSHPLPSDPPSHPPPRKIARRLKNNNEEIDNNKVDILFKAIDVPLPLYVQSVKDIYAQYILLSSKSRESNPYYVSYLSFDSFLYSDYIPIITFQSIRGENENKEEKKSDRNRKRKIRDDFIKSEKKKSKGKFYKFNVREKNFKNKLSYKYG
ncbi:uncharacterized protein OCT59_013992 [Rhizophagus irregularis]|uniref:F-box domain-containing protein n=1 Tax=Rhizophagus irregularis (strain DAOM 197198w) TaxID=1432141 RepID=A0A015JMI4_RHIIW|nr:hypothetical protein RirG_085070 [Rhizophagus irregularis DAOM 197198w]UZO21605.1 hypothetical protein OCT59_013992 [Rhizophagus irregularis]GBC23098.1 hypothetical protein GLOIN_2v1837894 [Rhizophagus irregularis DAOM 181602=DAOM 197198]CAB5215958.1 unnamed protein product [Rhizophagus irregularis]